MTSPPIVWIDCEMTGLSIESDALVEIACVVTGSDLEPLDSGLDLIITPPAEAVAAMDDVVRTMHTDSGLLEELSSGIDLAEAERRVLEYVRSHIAEPRRAPLAGSSIHVDRMFLARDMPALTEHLHYRIIDVSSIKELARRWYPRAYFQAPQKRGGHRALADILDSIKELRYYRDAVFVPPPGPTSDEARQVAQTGPTENPL
jgi:oligoribonuclease